MNQWDYVVVGAGAAGCILASRLSEEAGARVLLLEAGGHRSSPLLSVPAGETLLVGNPRYDWRFQTEPDETLKDRRLRIPRGRLLGGSNAINGMLFVRGQRSDFEDWGSHAAGWSWADVLPHFRKLEDWEGGSNATRGVGGPIRIELPRQREPLCDTFLRAAEELGYRRNLDYNSGDLEGFGYYQCTQRRGRRVSVVDGYMSNRRSNLVVQTDALVHGLTFEGKRCTGLRYTRGGEIHHVRVTREVILASGAVGSPQILELSGIGSRGVLEKAGVPVFHELPAVGENFQDHFASRLRWRVLDRVSFNERLRGVGLLRELARYAITRRGVLSLPIAVGFGFVRSTPDQPTPDLQFHFAPASYTSGPRRALESEPGMTLGAYPLRPDSKGSIHIASNDPQQAPAIATRFLSAPMDVTRLLAGIRIGRRLIGATAFDALRGEETTPGAKQLTDEELLAFVREQGDTSFHPMGTCRMGDDSAAVVDARLRVRGLSGLRVVDASVMPSMVSGNTQAATMMIAEKGAAMIQQDAWSAVRDANRSVAPQPGGT
jgi:choline dehydrogenase-like flavoprotein